MNPAEEPRAAPSDFSPIDFRGELNEEQYAAVTAPPGPALVLAGAGSGKTRTLTYRVAWLLTQGVSPREILLLTFTNKAAHEMLRRVEELTGVPRHKFWGGTFHHIGQKTLRIHGEAAGLRREFTIMDEDDAASLISEVVKQTDKNFFKNKAHPKAKVIESVISYARNTMRPFDEVVFQRYPWLDFLIEKFKQFARTYRETKLDRQVADFDDLLELWLLLLRQEKKVAAYYQNRFQHILVDEYQDTNRLQAEIIDLLALRHQIMAVGDDAQCIYTWRGADYQNIMSFTERHPGAAIYKIETNYRSTDPILRLANHVLASQPLGTGYRKELRAVRQGRAVPYVAALMDTRQQAQFIISRIAGLQEEGRRLSDIAVLYRAHYQAMDAQVELSRRGVPFVITSGVRFFEQAHIRDLTAQLRFLANPRDAAAFERFTCLLPKIGEKTARRLHQLTADTANKENISPAQALLREPVVKKVPKDARENWSQMACALADAEDALRPAPAKGKKTAAVRPPAEVTRILIEGWYGDYLRLIYPKWETRREDLGALAAFAERHDDMNELLAQLMLLSSETGNRSADAREDCVRLTTIHQAKGLEFPVVFLIGAADGLLPLRRAIESGDIEEERRLFYVAVTRARDELYLAYPMFNSQGGAAAHSPPSRFLEEIPRAQYEILRYGGGE